MVSIDIKTNQTICVSMLSLILSLLEIEKPSLPGIWHRISESHKCCPAGQGGSEKPMKKNEHLKLL